MKRVLAGFAVLVLVAVVAAIGFMLSFDINRYKPTLVAMIAERTGRSFAIDGDIRFVPAMVPTIALDGVRIGNVPWDKRGELLAVEQIEARVALRPLLSRRIEVKRIAIIGATVNLATSTKGEHNWTLALPVADSEAGAPAIAALAVDEVTLEKVTVRYAGAADTAEATIAKAVVHSRPGGGLSAISEILIDAAELDYRAGTRNIKLDLVTVAALSAKPEAPVIVTLVGIYDKMPLALRTTLGSWSELVAADKLPFAIEGTVGAVRAQLRGTVQPAAGLNGLATTVELEADNGAVLGALLGAEIPAVAPATVKVELAPSDERIVFSKLAAKLGGSDLAGEGSVSLSGPRPRIQGVLSSERIDLTEFMPAPAKDSAATRIFSTTPLALATLNSLDFAGSVRVATLKTHSATLAPLKADVVLKDGQLTLAPATAGFAGGTLDLRLKLNSGERARIDLDLHATGIMPAQLPQLTGKSVIEDGRTDVHFKLNGSGVSPAELMGGGNGQLLVRVGRGVLPRAGIGTASTDILLGTLNGLNPLATQDPRTQLECAVLNFNIVNGLASTEHGLAVRTDKLNVLGGGTVDLKTERIDIGAKPKPRQGVGLNLAAIGDFVRLGGTLSKPVPVTDAKGAATAGIKVGAAVATGGISLLAEGLFDRATTDEDVCAIAAGERQLPSTTSTSGAAANGAAPAAGQTSVIGKAADTTKNAVDSVGNAVKGVFKGLFGR